MAKQIQIELSIATSEDDELEHWGYYNSIDEAIEALERLKEIYQPD